MHTRNHRTGRWLLALSMAALLLLGACGPANDTTPTQSVDAIYTSAFQTIAAQQATQQALIPPTNTPPPPTTAPTLPPPSPIATFALASPTLRTGGGGTACDSSAYVSDVTIPDNTLVSAGKTFTKTWSLLNNGTCTWSTGYKLVFDSGEQMGGSTSAITTAVPAGTVGNVSVSLKAPDTNGTYTGTWRMQNPSGQSFGSFITVVIKVGSGATATAGPSPTPGGDVFTISGSLGAVDVTLDFSGVTGSIPVVSYDGKDYSFTVPKGWSGTITPSKGVSGKWIFDPVDKSFTNVKNDKTQDFIAIPVTPTP